jgi:hypothetical protein
MHDRLASGNDAGMERWASKCPLGVVLLAGAVLAIVASFTRPFTLPADVVTALPCGAGAVAVLARYRGRLPAARYRGRLPAGSSGNGRSGPVLSGSDPTAPMLSGQGLSGTDRTPVWRWAIPVVVVLVVIAWELTALRGSPRIAHPTLSSLIDIVDGWRPGKGAAFALWLVLGGWLILGRRPRRQNSTEQNVTGPTATGTP